MIAAAVVRSLRVSRTRPTGRSSVSPGSPLTRGMTATPVSNPDNPRCDSRLIAQGGEVVDTGEAHDLPPRMSGVRRSGLRVRAVMPGRVGRQPLQQPLTYRMAPLLGRGCDHRINPLVERCGSIVP